MSYAYSQNANSKIPSEENSNMAVIPVRGIVPTELVLRSCRLIPELASPAW